MLFKYKVTRFSYCKTAHACYEIEVEHAKLTTTASLVHFLYLYIEYLSTAS